MHNEVNPEEKLRRKIVLKNRLSPRIRDQSGFFLPTRISPQGRQDWA